MVLAVSGVAIFNTMLYIAAQTTTATNITLLHQLLPAATVLLAWPILLHRPTKRQIYAMTISFAGVVIIVSRGTLAILLGLKFNIGDVLMIAGTMAWALYSVLLNRYRLGLHPLSLVTVLSVIALPLIFPFYLLEHHDIGGFDVNAQTLTIIFYTAIMASIVALLLWNHGVAVVGPHVAAMFGYFHPLFTILLAVLFLDERLQLFHYLGGALVLSGVYLAIMEPARALRAGSSREAQEPT